MKIFRSLRKQLMGEGKTSRYIKYAIGEILLVMIGILLALQVNNWNEKRKQKAELDNILRIISYDMETDTLVANQVISYYEAHNENSKRIINKELNRTNFMECRECIALVTVYRPMNIQTKGFELLKNMPNQISTQRDSLVTNITQIYAIFKANIDKSNDRLENDVMSNMKDLQEYDWYVNWTQGTPHQDMIIYFTESEDYRKRVASHNLLATGNHAALVKEYKRQATEVLKRINQRLNSD